MNVIEELLNAIPQADVPGIGKWKFKILKYPTDIPRDYVVPPAQVRHDANGLKDCKVAIVSAQAALGKTTFSQFCAGKKQALLWDLTSGYHLGEGSLTGILVKEYLPGNLEILRTAAEAGYLVIVVDALDEGRSRTTEPNFQAFLKDIASMAAHARNCCFVLTGRTLTAEEAWIILELEGVSTTILNLDYLPHESQVAYLDKKIDEVVKRDPKYESVRDDLLRKIMYVAQSEGTASEQATLITGLQFMGYPPVLNVVAEYINKTSDLRKIEHDILEEKFNTAVDQDLHPVFIGVAALDKIIESVALREQDKVHSHIFTKLGNDSGTESEIIRTLFKPCEQGALLLRRIMGESYQLPQVLSSKLQDIYRSILDVELPEHPFLVDGKSLESNIFGAWLTAELLVNGDDDVKKLLEAYLGKRQPNSSHLFALFYFLKVYGKNYADNFASSSHRFEPWVFSHLLNSVSSIESDKLRTSLDISDHEIDKGVYDVQLHFSTPSGSESDRMTLEFELIKLNDSDPLFISSVLPPCTINSTSLDIRFSSQSGEFLILGPANIQCKGIEFACTDLVVRPRQMKEQDVLVSLMAKTIVSHLQKPPIVHCKLKVSWPGGLEWPWSAFYNNDASQFEEQRNIPSEDTKIRHVKRLLRYFTRSTHIGESVINMKLSPRGAEFFKTTLPSLLKNGIFVEIENYGSASQRRFKLGLPNQVINEALEICNGDFETFLKTCKNVD